MESFSFESLFYKFGKISVEKGHDLLKNIAGHQRTLRKYLNILQFAKDSLI